VSGDVFTFQSAPYRPGSRWHVIAKKGRDGTWDYAAGWSRERLEWLCDGIVRDETKRRYEIRGSEFYQNQYDFIKPILDMASPKKKAELMAIADKLRAHGEPRSHTTALQKSTLLITKLKGSTNE